MTIADLYHAKAIPFNIEESEIFRKGINLSRTVGPDYFPLNRNRIGGEVLDLNWKSYLTKTTKDMMVEAEVFGLVFFGELSMIKGRPLINIIGLFFKLPWLYWV